MISFDDFKRMDLRVAKIVDVRDHPNADKLYVIELDVGEESKITVARVKGHYTKDALLGKKVVVVNNLAPANIRGVQSFAMILCAQQEERLSLIVPDEDVSPGAVVL